MRLLKQLLTYTLITVATLAITAALLGYLYQDAIISRLKNELNNQLNAEIKVKEVSVNVFRAFPLVSVEFHHILAYEANTYATLPDTLFYLERLSMAFDVFELMKDHYELKHISAVEGKVFMKIDKNGAENFMILSADTSSGTFSTNLKKASFTNIDFSFTNGRTGNIYNLYLFDITAKGAFSDIDYTTALYGKVKVNQLDIFETSYLTNEFVNLDVAIDGNTLEKVFRVTKGYITLRNAYKLKVTGKSSPGIYNFDFDSEKLDLAGFRKLIPPKFTAKIANFKLEGKGTFHVNVANEKNRGIGRYSGYVKIKNSSLTNTRTNEHIGLTDVEATFDSGKKGTLASTEIYFSHFDINIESGSATGSLKLQNLEKPTFLLQLNGQVNLEDVYNFLEPKNIESLSGKSKLELTLSGKLAVFDTITAKDLKTFRLTGKMLLKNMGLKTSSALRISDLNTHIKFNDQTLVLDKINGRYNKLHVQGSMMIDKWLSYLRDQSKQLTVKGEFTLGEVTSAMFGSGSAGGFAIPNWLNAHIKIAVKSFTHPPFTATDIKGLLRISPGKMSVSSITLNTMEGQLLADLALTIKETGQLHLQGHTQLNEIKIDEFFRQFDNFGQKTITDKHLRGLARVDADFHFDMDNTFKISLPSILIEGDVEIKNGELIELKPLYSIPSEITDKSIIGLFINLEAFEEKLHHIHFSEMKNHILVQNEKVVLPKMEIKSDALNLNLRGTHSFDNVVDYYMDFRLKEVLSKDKKVEKDYGYIQNDTKGGKIIFLHVYGPTDNLTVELDKQGSRQNRKEKIDKEINTTKAILNEEMGLFKNSDIDTTLLEKESFEYDMDMDAFNEALENDSLKQAESDSLKTDSTDTKNGLFKKKKKKKKKKKDDSEFEEWDFDDEDL